MKLFTKTLVLLVAVMLFSMAGFAATSAAGTNTVSPTLRVSVNVQNAVQLTLSTATQCPITNGTAPDDYAINFGNVNGLGVGTPTCGTVTPGTGNATYATDYQITPSFSGSTGTSGTITVAQSTAFTHSSVLTLKEGPNVAGFNPLTSTPINISTTAANGTPITRFLGVTVAVQNGPGAFTGADSSVVTFTLTVP